MIRVRLVSLDRAPYHILNRRKAAYQGLSYKRILDRSCRTPSHGDKARRACRDRFIARSAPAWNPQNVPDPQTLPSVELSLEDCVRAQMTAVQNNDEPWTNHGIQTMYEFAADVGEMERSWYFGFSKDLYHFDHFLGAFLNSFPDLIGCTEFEIGQPTDYDERLKRIEVAVCDRDGNPCGPFAFLLCVKPNGNRKGCWMTKAVLRRPMDES